VEAYVSHPLGTEALDPDESDEPEGELPNPTAGEFFVAVLGLSPTAVSGLSVVEQAIIRGAITTDIKPNFESVESFIICY
jgi:hypothetical protein